MNDYLLDYLHKAENLARISHEGQFDKGGQPYYHHVETVSRTTGDMIHNWHNTSNDFLLKAQIVGYLHDIVEDTKVTMKDLWNLKFPTDSIQAIEILTKVDGVSYQEYLARVKRYKLAAVVKINDMIHNSDLSRMIHVIDSDRERQKKYLLAIDYLLGSI